MSLGLKKCATENRWTAKVFIIGFLGLCVAACSPRIIETIKTETITEYRDTTQWRDTTIYVPVPIGKDKAVVSVRDTSRLETQVASSIAYVDSLGIHHTLENKAVSFPAVVMIPSRTIWLSVTTKEAQVLTRTLEVEKPLSWWQKFRIGAFWWLLCGLIVALLWIFRKPILKLIKLW